MFFAAALSLVPLTAAVQDDIAGETMLAASSFLFDLWLLALCVVLLKHITHRSSCQNLPQEATTLTE